MEVLRKIGPTELRFTTLKKRRQMYTLYGVGITFYIRRGHDRRVRRVAMKERTAMTLVDMYAPLAFILMENFWHSAKETC